MKRESCSRGCNVQMRKGQFDDKQDPADYDVCNTAIKGRGCDNIKRIEFVEQYKKMLVRWPIGNI